MIFITQHLLTPGSCDFMYLLMADSLTLWKHSNILNNHEYNIKTRQNVLRTSCRGTANGNNY